MTKERKTTKQKPNKKQTNKQTNKNKNKKTSKKNINWEESSRLKANSKVDTSGPFFRHLHVVVVQEWQRNAKIKAWCTCKVVVLLIKPIVLLKFSSPSCRWIFVVIKWTRMLDGKANGCSQWFPSHRSVASGLEKPGLAGYKNKHNSDKFGFVRK